MPRAPRKCFPGAKYHVTARGNWRSVVFPEMEDYEKFIGQLESALNRDGVILYAYALMPNHFHLFVETPQGNLSKFMQRLSTAYSMYFRHKRRKPGHCFQGRYSAQVVSGDEYILRVTRYIHLNPVKVKFLAKASLQERLFHLAAYRWNSYHGYADGAHAERFVNYRWLCLMQRPTEAENREAYRKYVDGMAAGQDDVIAEAMRRKSAVVADEAESNRIAPELKRAQPLDIALVKQAVAMSFGVRVEDLNFHGHREGVAKAVAVELACLYSGLPQYAVAKHFGYTSETSVGKLRRKAVALMEHEPSIKERMEKVRELLVR